MAVVNFLMAGAAAGLFLLVAAASMSSLQDPSELLMRHPERVHAVGDDGCLGRECNMSGRAARRDLFGFFNKFLSSEHSPEEMLKSKGSQVIPVVKKHKLLRSRKAQKDLQDYFESLPHKKTARVLSAEKESSGQELAKFPDDEAKKDLQKFFSGLPHHVSDSVKQSRTSAETEAQRRHSEAVARRQAENAR